MKIDKDQINYALRQVFMHADYDLYKQYNKAEDDEDFDSLTHLFIVKIEEHTDRFSA